MSPVPDIKLADGNTIPQIGLGLWQVTEQADFNIAFDAALDCGYRHFDSAQAYRNEQYLGERWQASDASRSDLFITTKIDVRHFSPSSLRSSFAQSLDKLKTDYVDLLLLHFPVPVLRKKAWIELEKIKDGGQAKSIGVSNYTVRHLEELFSYANQRPVINQVELHLFLQQPALIDFCRDHNIQVEAYSPLARARVLDDPVVKEIAKQHSKSYAQIMLRYLIELGLVVIPKSVTPERIKQNIDLFDFNLTKDEMAQLAKLDRDQRFCWSPVHIP